MESSIFDLIVLGQRLSGLTSVTLNVHNVCDTPIQTRQEPNPSGVVCCVAHVYIVTRNTFIAPTDCYLV